MLANEIEGATSSERLGDLERLGDHLTSRHGVALLAGRGNKAAVPPWSEGASSHSVSIRNHSRIPGLCLLSRPPETTPS